MSDPSPKQQKRKKSFIHNFFTKYDDISVRCTICLRIYKNYGNTTNLLNHLQRMHSEYIDSNDSSEQKKICQMVTSIDEESEELDSVSELSTSTSTQSQELSSCTSMCTSERKIPVCSTSKNSLPKFQIQPSIDKAFHKIETYRGN